MKLTAHTLPSRKYEQIVMQREASKKIHHCEGQKGEEGHFLWAAQFMVLILLSHYNILSRQILFSLPYG